MVSQISTITGCRNCGNSNLLPIFNYGDLPLANDLADTCEAAQQRLKYPLTLVVCPLCQLVQILETVNPEILFSNYTYFSSYSDTMLLHAKELVNKLIKSKKLDSKSLVIEIASNDGYLLKNFVEQKIPCFGVEPAKNISDVANAKDIPTKCNFWTEDFARQLRGDGIEADVIIGNNVLAHVADLHDFLSGITHVLKSDGLVVFEVPYAGEMFKNVEFDTVYHEHLCYFSLSSISSLLRRHGLTIDKAEFLPIHGGSIRIFASHFSISLSDEFYAMCDRETENQLFHPNTYRKYSEGITVLKKGLFGLLQNIKAAGKTIAVYGASAKGSTLLNLFGIDGRLIDFVVDRSDYKQGKYMSGSGLPILHPKALLEKKPDYTLILTWNFMDEIIRQQHEYLAGGGKFIHPLKLTIFSHY